MLEHVELILSMKTIRQVAIMLERIQLCIIWPYGATLKCGEVVGLLEKPDSQCNICFSKSGWDECLATMEVARSWTTCKTQEVILPYRAKAFRSVSSNKEVKRYRYWSKRSKILQKLKQKVNNQEIRARSQKQKRSKSESKLRGLWLRD